MFLQQKPSGSRLICDKHDNQDQSSLYLQEKYIELNLQNMCYETIRVDVFVWYWRNWLVLVGCSL